MMDTLISKLKIAVAKTNCMFVQVFKPTIKHHWKLYMLSDLLRS